MLGSSTCVSAEGAPCKVTVAEADEIVTKCPELASGPTLESEGKQKKFKILQLTLQFSFKLQWINGITFTSKSELNQLWRKLDVQLCGT